MSFALLFSGQGTQHPAMLPWLADDAWVYTESETAPSTLGLPANWRLHREQKSGRVYYSLWQRMAEIVG